MALEPFFPPRILTVLVLLLAVAVHADFGDYVDPTYNCPATTTCPVICVASEVDCPTSCSGANQTLCLDGTCSDANSACVEGLASPCPEYDCSAVACAKVIDFYNTCFALYGSYYDNATSCSEAQEEEETQLLSWTDAGFVVCYCWIIIVTFLIIAWCAFNQRLSPVSGSSMVLPVVPSIAAATSSDGNEMDHMESDTPMAWQTGYKLHPVGLVIYALTLLTLTAFHGLLAFLVIQYYIISGGITAFSGVFEDEEQCLKAFIILWLVGFIWSFALKFPNSIHDIFLRRCRLGEATHVAVCVQRDVSSTATAYSVGHLRQAREFFGAFFRLVQMLMRAIFSEVEDHGRQQGDAAYKVCRVFRQIDGSRYFSFQFRRYNLSEERGLYVPGVFSVGTTMADLLVAGSVKDGLSSEIVQQRKLVVGPNTIEVPRPTYLSTLFQKELTKSFYTYQAFM